MEKDFRKSVSEDAVDVLAPSGDSYEYDDGLPFDTVKLPSKGLVYPEEHPLHRKEEVEFKPMTAHEENILSSPALMKQGTVLSVLVKSCLIDKSVDPDSLLLGDKAAILLAIRISGFSEEYVTKTICPSCGKDNRYRFDLSKAEIKRLGAEPIIEGRNLFEFTLPKSKKKVKFSLLTDGDDLDIIRTQERRKKVSSSAIDTTITDRLKVQIKEVEGIKERDQIARFIDRMPVLDSRSLRKYMSEIEPDVVMKEEVTCVHCAAVTERHAPMGYDFFWPRLDQ